MYVLTVSSMIGQDDRSLADIGAMCWNRWYCLRGTVEHARRARGTLVVEHPRLLIFDGGGAAAEV